MRAQSILLSCLLVAGLACNRGGSAGGDKAAKGDGSAAPADGKYVEGKGKGDPASRPVPVVTTVAEKSDVPIYLDGLGSVAAYYTVTITPLVDGRIESMPFQEGQVVKKGDLLAQIDPRPYQVALHQAEGALIRDQAQLKTAQTDLARYQDLAKQKLIAQQQADDQAGVVGQAEGAVKVDQAQIESARLNIEYASITAPIDGITGIRLVDPGNVVHAAASTQIVTLTQLDPIAVLFTLPEDVLPDVAKEMVTNQLPVEAWSRDGTRKLGEGKTLLINNQINQATATLQIKAIFPNPDHALWPNQFVKAKLLLKTRHDVIAVPAAVVQRGPKGTFAYTVDADKNAKLTPIEVEMIAGDSAIISTGLSAGDEVVVDGQNSLKPGAKVSAKPMAPPAAPHGKITEREAHAGTPQ